MPINAIRHERNDAAAPWDELLAAMAQGDQSALTAFYDHTHRAVFGLLLRMLPERAAAETVLLEVYEQVWRAAGQAFDASREPLTWLIELARQRALARLRIAPRPKNAPFCHAILPECETAPPESGWLNERSQQARKAMMRLTPEQRTTLERVYFSGLSYSESAAQLGRSPDEVKALLHAGLRTLKVYLHAQSSASADGERG